MPLFLEELISDNIFISYECEEHIMQKRYGKVGYVAMKLDMSKIYDRVEWGFLERVLLHMGFPQSWVVLITDCISTVSFLVLINSQPRGFIQPKEVSGKEIRCRLIYFSSVLRASLLCYLILLT